MFDIEKFEPEIAELCRRLKISRLDVFGSATSESEEFRAESDIDVLVRFEQDGGGLFNRYFDLKEGLEAIFGRPVDVVVEDSLKNPYFRASVERSRRAVYAG
jgi:predicted nucleotidyltransferase